MMCMDHYELGLPIYENFMERKKCVHNDDMLENELMYLY